MSTNFKLKLKESENWYTARRVGPTRVDITKWSDDCCEPLEVYPILGSKCGCLGAIQTPFCKHMRILAEFRSRQDNGHQVYGWAYNPDAPDSANILGSAWRQWVPTNLLGRDIKELL